MHKAQIQKKMISIFFFEFAFCLHSSVPLCTLKDSEVCGGAWRVSVARRVAS